MRTMSRASRLVATAIFGLTAAGLLASPAAATGPTSGAGGAPGRAQAAVVASAPQTSSGAGSSTSADVTSGPVGRPGFTMGGSTGAPADPAAAAPADPAAAARAVHQAAALAASGNGALAASGDGVAASYTHTPAVGAQGTVPAGSGPTMHTLTIYEVFWLPSGYHFGASATDDTTYESLLERFASDVGGSQYYNLVTQYYDASNSNAHITGTASFGGAFVDTTTPYPETGSTTDPLEDSEIQTEVHHAAATEGWTEDINHFIAVFTANGMQECDGGISDGNCTFPVSPDAKGEFCAYHNWFTDGSDDAQYAFMGYDNMFHGSGQTCVAGETSGDNDPNRSTYPNGSQSADAEVSTFSHEMMESVTDPHPNNAWTDSSGNEVGDLCNFNYAPRNDIGADVYLNGHPYIVQQIYSNAAQTCAIDLPTNGFCPGSASSVCAPTVTFGKAVDNSTPEVSRSATYTVTLDNTSDTAAATNLVFTDSIPSGYVVTNVTAASSTSESNTTSSVTVDYDTLAVHQSRTITITVTVPAQAGTPATNCGGLALQDLIGTVLSSQTTIPCATTTPELIPTTLTYTGAATGAYNQSATVSAHLVDDLANDLSGESVTFTLNGTETCSDTTDASGNASCTITPGEVAGTYPLVASFTATNTYGSSSAPTSYVITLVLTSPPLPNPTWETPYSTTITALGGSGTVTFSKISGTLPTGVNLGSNGVLMGTPTDKTQIGQPFTFTVQATDPRPASGSQAYTIKVLSPCTVTTLTPYFLSATSHTGNFTGFFCVNSAGIGTYAQNGGPTGTGTLTTTGGTTRITAFGKDLALLGEENSWSSTFTETAPAPEKAGTFTLL